MLNSNADIQSSGPELAEGAAAEEIKNTKNNTWLRILGFNFDMQMANEKPGNRFTGYEININGATYYEALTPALPEKAPDGSRLYGICGGIGFPHDTVTSSRTILLPLPNFLIPKGGQWVAIAPTKIAGDTFPLFRLVYEWLYSG